MKVIKIFLASSINDLHVERMEIGNFIRSMNDRFIDRGIYFKLCMCEDISDAVAKSRKQDEYNAIIRECDFFYVIFWHKAGVYTVEEFEVALAQFRDTGSPKIQTYFKAVEEGDSVEQSVTDFMRRLEREVDHFHTTFTHTDTIMLKLLTFLSEEADTRMNLEMKDGKLWVDQTHMAAVHVENLPFYRNHEGINRLRAEIAELEEQKAAARLAVMRNPDDQEAWDKVYAISARWNQLQEELHQYEMQLLETSMRLTKLTADGTYVTLRTKQAIELFEAGRLKEALDVLDMDAFEADLRRAEETAGQSRKQMEALVKELTTRIDILKSQGITKENATEIKELYEKARRITLEHRLGLDCVYGFMIFLYSQNDYIRALQVGEQLYHEYKSRGDTEEADWARLCNSLAVLHSKMQHSTKAEALYIEALEIRRRLAAANPASYEPDMAATCNNLALLYSTHQRTSEAEDLYKEALEICRRLTAANPASYEPDVATTCNNLANLYSDIQRRAEAEKLYAEALEIRRRLAAANPASYEPAVAMTCNNLAILYGKTQRPAEAEKLYTEALEILRRLAAANPASYEPAVATTCDNLANLYSDPQRPAEAEALYIEALEIYRRLAAANPASYEPAVATTCDNLANLYSDTQRPAEAEKLYTEALEILRRLAAANPANYEPNVAMTCNNLAILYSDTQRPAEALYIEALEIYRRLAAANPASYEPDVAMTCNNLAILYKNTQRLAEAEALYIEALEIYRRLAAATPASYEPDVAMTCYNLALFCNNNDPEKAEFLRKEAFQIAQKYKETDHLCSIIYNRLKPLFE